VPAVFTHDDARLWAAAKIVTTVNAIQATVTRSAAFISYGVTTQARRPMALPIVTADPSSLPTPRFDRHHESQTHFFGRWTTPLARRRFTAFGHASGPGDLTIRLKQTLKKRRSGLGSGLGACRRETSEPARHWSPRHQPFVAWSGNSVPSRRI
jgi:hypothetical protein